MQEKEVIKLLQSLKDDPAFGGGFDFQKSWSKFAASYDFDPEARSVRYTMRDYVETYLWQFTHSMLKPVAAVMAVFVFAVAGSISLVGASGQALPGDQLYAVKVGIEKVQLALAVDAQARSQLRVEFASRRLDEMVAVAAQVQSSESGNVQLAANRFKSEVVNIQEELSIEGTSDVQKEFAKTVGRKVEAYSSTVASTGSDLPEEVLGEVEEILEETKDQAVEVIITAHEVEQDEDSAHELDVALDKEIESASVLYGEAASEAIATAEALRLEGLYRRAFQVLKDFAFEADFNN
ncbi:hypothetical protein HY630_02655 [Candidatus Uhrbacteria bacterium]|nr:hypothetical protein [Candidatus Uhrbacteria bacterium]